jgi:hypothetical protein
VTPQIVQSGVLFTFVSDRLLRPVHQEYAPTNALQQKMEYLADRHIHGRKEKLLLQKTSPMRKAGSSVALPSSFHHPV